MRCFGLKESEETVSSGLDLQMQLIASSVAMAILRAAWGSRPTLSSNLSALRGLSHSRPWAVWPCRGYSSYDGQVLGGRAKGDESRYIQY